MFYPGVVRTGTESGIRVRNSGTKPRLKKHQLLDAYNYAYIIFFEIIPIFVKLKIT